MDVVREDMSIVDVREGQPMQRTGEDRGGWVAVATLLNTLLRPKKEEKVKESHSMFLLLDDSYQKMSGKELLYLKISIWNVCMYKISNQDITAAKPEKCVSKYKHYIDEN